MIDSPSRAGGVGKGESTSISSLLSQDGKIVGQKKTTDSPCKDSGGATGLGVLGVGHQSWRLSLQHGDAQRAAKDHLSPL